MSRVMPSPTMSVMTNTTFPLGRAALVTAAALVLSLVVSSLSDKPGNGNDGGLAEVANVAGVLLAATLIVIGVAALVRVLRRS